MLHGEYAQLPMFRSVALLCRFNIWNFLWSLVFNILCPKQKLIIQTNNKAKYEKRYQLLLLFATNKRSHDKNKSRDLTFQFTIYRWALFEIWPMSFLSSAVNQHGALSSPKKIQKPKNSKSSMKYSNTERSHTESLKQ